MPFANNLTLKGINPEWAERRSSYRNIAEVPIRVVPIATLYDADPDNLNFFSLSLNRSSTLGVKLTKRVNTSGEEVTKKEYKKEGYV